MDAIVNVSGIDPDKPLKVVVDCASGAGSELSPEALRRAGMNVITLNAQPDGFFPGRNPEPNSANLQKLMKTVKVIGADLGIAHDGDADRMITVDEKGNISDFDKLLTVMAREFGGTVVTTVDASACLDTEMKKMNCKVLRTPVGDVHVAESITENNATFGGEPSGPGYILISTCVQMAYYPAFVLLNVYMIMAHYPSNLTVLKIIQQ